MENCKIITVANQKGGTSKTTTACNLAHALSEQGHKVLMVDFDPQANLTLGFGVERPIELALSMHNLLTMLMDGEPLPNKADYIMHGSKVDIIPCNKNLSVTEINLRNELGGEPTLSELLEPLRSDYHFIIIDTNPYLGLLTINALVEQIALADCMDLYNLCVDIKKADMLRKYSEKGKLNGDIIKRILSGAVDHKPDRTPTIKVSKAVYAKYFKPNQPAKEVQDIVEKALEMYFEQNRAEL